MSEWIPYVEKKYTSNKLMKMMLRATIKTLDPMAMNMFSPHNYKEYRRLMKVLTDGYK